MYFVHENPVRSSFPDFQMAPGKGGVQFMRHDSDLLEASQSGSIQALHAFHGALLPGTIANALDTPFYRAHWSGCSLRHVGLDGLAELPPVEKDHIRAAGDAARNRAGVICDDVFTTGTTGNPLITVRSDREQAFIANFFARVLRDRPPGPLLRGLEFKNPYHGHLVRVPGAAHYHRVSVFDASSFEYGRTTLLRSHNDANVDARCSVLMGLERCLRAFTLDTLRTYPDGFPATALRLVVSYSQYLTQAWRRRLQETWGAPVVDRFGVSEVFGGASQCLACGWYHFEPFVIAEVIGAKSGNPISTGQGLLALTALSPFQQAQPLIRYLTGDLVEVTHTSSCRPGTTAIKPLGRARYGVPKPGGDRWLVTPASVLEAVDEVPEIERTARFAGIEQVRDPHAVGNPKFRTRWSQQGGVVAVKVEVALCDGLSERRRFDILAELRDEVLRRNNALADALQDNAATLDVDACDGIEEGDLIAQAHSGGVWSAA
ncbi:hypothetical protein [Xanthomonas rydalmerensis]|uniref:Uncharacterized protein n=1 Tax=Xanthomonas rydalmerensis TaxID=3046274 RepID=A0ABZ0JH34_9XANT|nr:hypothetical protein [Xanthomonas sp. DM-2023]WOS39114.1 hypothetical protein QN243_11695 [Xanthomonas sp. DM-2023]WOS43297.1 hypothetical protein QN242_11695 [Xanthomonas sp. DM-2023]WOS47476.1 hypothetical protein QN240_11695 [Xanthomonas sp. DM-2023]WOS51657.1 hypothetical protein QN244_11695 [Xanthomonas sp. DM-2023]WOS55839.1 hypothetical protein QN245_11695 [Xanthomonas sp. DM-2023]